MKRTLFLSIAFALFCIPSLAQDITGKIKGVVVSPKNARVLGTTISLENKRFRKTITANPDGEYEIELPVGYYVVKAYQVGFRPYRLKSLRLEANQTRILNIKLKFAATKAFKCPAGVPCL
jgi:hypothetical protein